MENRRLLLATCCAAALVVPAAAGAKTLTKPLFTIVYLRHSGSSVAGHLVRYNRRRLVIVLANKKRKHLRWSQITVSSAFTLRARLIDQKKASAWLGLGEYGWKLGLKRLARNALNRAAAMSPALRHKVNAILQTAPGRGNNGGSTSGAGSDRGRRHRHSRSGHRGSRSHRGRSLGGGGIRGKLYRPARSGAAETEHKDALAIAKTLNSRPTRYGLREVKTKHFDIFTDWRANDRAGAGRSLENVYRAVARSLHVPRHAPVFAGRLPVFLMLSTGEMWKLRTLAQNKYNCTFTDDLYSQGTVGSGPHFNFIMNSHPNSVYLNNPRAQWLFICATQISREFLMRYRSKRPLKGWLATGLATLIADRFTGGTWDNYFACQNMLNGPPIRGLFRGTYNGNTAGAAESVVGVLLVRNHKAFLRVLRDQKAGLTFHHALRKEYHLTYRQLGDVWHAYMEAVIARGNMGN